MARVHGLENTTGPACWRFSIIWRELLPGRRLIRRVMKLIWRIFSVVVCRYKNIMDSLRAQSVTPLARIRHRRRPVLLNGLLALLFVAQVVIPIQSHTRWAVDDNGHVVEICTLHGTVNTDPASDESTSRSPAMAFSLLLAEALCAHIDIQPSWLALLFVPTSPAVLGRPTQRSVHHALIRGPPSLV